MPRLQSIAVFLEKDDVVPSFSETLHPCTPMAPSPIRSVDDPVAEKAPKAVSDSHLAISPSLLDQPAIAEKQRI